MPAVVDCFQPATSSGTEPLIIPKLGKKYAERSPCTRVYTLAACERTLTRAPTRTHLRKVSQKNNGDIK